MPARVNEEGTSCEVVAISCGTSQKRGQQVKLTCIMDNTSHLLYHTVENPSSSFSSTLLRLQCKEEMLLQLIPACSHQAVQQHLIENPKSLF